MHVLHQGQQLSAIANTKAAPDASLKDFLILLEPMCMGLVTLKKLPHAKPLAWIVCSVLVYFKDALMQLLVTAENKEYQTDFQSS